MIVPADYEEAKKATIAMGEMVGPAYIRFGRSPVPMFTTSDSPFELGKANVVMEGTDVAIIANGALVWESVLAAKELAKKGIKARVVNVHTVKPFDFATVTAAARECRPPAAPHRSRTPRCGSAGRAGPGDHEAAASAFASRAGTGTKRCTLVSCEREEPPERVRLRGILYLERQPGVAQGHPQAKARG